MNELRVHISDYAVACGDAEIVTLGLGSCVAIVLYDRVGSIGALAHVLLPDPELVRDQSNLARFPGTAVPMMVGKLRELGSRGTLVAKLVGGASMFGSLITGNALNVGARNIQASREALDRAGIPIAGEDVGGEVGRSVRFSVSTGNVAVRTVRGAESVL